jgi:hypothetical protein
MHMTVTLVRLGYQRFFIGSRMARAYPRAPSNTFMPCYGRHPVTPWSLISSCRPTLSSVPSGHVRLSPSQGKYGRPASSAFLDAASKHRLFAFYRLAAYTGARRGELLNLHWRDIDLDGGEVRITGSAAVIAGQRIAGTTKSGRSRTVSIDAETVQVLRDHRKRQAEERLRVGPEWRGTDDHLFTTAWGEPIHPDTVSSLMTVLINAHDAPRTARSRPICPSMGGSTTCATSTPQPCCSRASRSMSSPPG